MVALRLLRQRSGVDTINLYMLSWKSWAAFLVIAPIVCLLVCGNSSLSARSSTATFYQNVLPILQQHCQTCHRASEIGPMPLVTYAQARKYAAEMKRMTSS